MSKNGVVWTTVAIEKMKEKTIYQSFKELYSDTLP